MPRVKRGTKRKDRRVKILEAGQGLLGRQKLRTTGPPKRPWRHALLYAYRDRRAKKRDFRRLWIIRIKAAANDQRADLQPLHPGPEKAGHRAGPEGPGRPGGERARDIRRPGPEGERRRGLAAGT